MRRRVRRIYGVLGVAVAVLAVAAPARADRLPAMRQSRVLAPGCVLVEWSATVPTGPGRYDRIGLHRVTTAGAARSHVGVSLAHGDVWGFDSAFLGSPDTAHSLPVLLARRGIDVWGIDFGWTLVPREETDFGFMRHGIQRDIDDLRLALTVARGLRAVSGAGTSRLALLGWSRGGWTGYGLLDRGRSAAVGPRGRARSCRSTTSTRPTTRTRGRSTCSAAQALQEAIAGGHDVADDTAFADLGLLADADPDAESPIFGVPPDSNLQASLTEGAAPFQFGRHADPVVPLRRRRIPPRRHDEIPLGLRFTSVARWIASSRVGHPTSLSSWSQTRRPSAALTGRPGGSTRI